jgi:very-short-patch-repair endonuclease
MMTFSRPSFATKVIGIALPTPTCFRANTQIKTAEGWKAIHLVQASDLAWTHRGRLRPVLGIQRRPHVGALLGLRIEGCQPVVWCTPEHRFLVPPLHQMERGPGGEVQTVEASSVLTPPPRCVGRGLGGEVSAAHVHAQLGGLNPSLIKLARDLRRESTEPENKLWQCLRGRKLDGYKFRRQHPLGADYIPDFYCSETKVSVELDGKIHDSRRAGWADGIRHRQIQEAGIRVLRFKNEQVETDLESVLREILEICESRRPHPLTPSPSDGEGEQEDNLPDRSGLTPLPPLHQMERGPAGEAQSAKVPPVLSPPPQLGGEFWCEARILRPGDLIIADDTRRIARLAAIRRVLTEETVFDLTIDEDHSFITEVGPAHNCSGGCQFSLRQL